MYKKTIIKPKSRINFGWKEIWEYRELLYFFTWKEIRVKYKQTSLGIIWTILQPLLYSLVFIAILKIRKGDEALTSSQFLSFYSCMLFWQLFYQSVTNSVTGMINYAGIIKKVYFPRLAIVLSVFFASTLDFLIGLLLLIIMSISIHWHDFLWITPLYWLGYIISAYIITGLFSIAASSLLSSVTVKFKDVRHALPFLIQLFFFLTPILYQIKDIDNKAVQLILSANPLALSTSIMHKLYLQEPVSISFFLPISILLASLIMGIYVFKSIEDYFADIV